MLPPVILCSATLLTDPMQPGGDALALQGEATAAAGFDGLSLWTLHHAAAVGAGASPEAVRAQVRDAGLSVPMVEAILPWASPDEKRALAAAEHAFSLAAEYGARYVVTVAMGADLPPLDAVVERYRRVCDAAAEHGLRPLIEFLPWTGFAIGAGFLFGALFVWTGNLLAPVTAHVVVNGVNLPRLVRRYGPAEPT